MEFNSDEFQKLSLKVAELSSELEKQNAIRAVSTKWLVLVGSLILAGLGFTNLVQIPKEAAKAAREQVGPEIINETKQIVSNIRAQDSLAQSILANLKNSATNTIGGAGTIAFFSRPGCPDGWEEFKEGSGRFLIASGEGYAFLSKGGKKEVALSIAEMPKHTHNATSLASEKGFSKGPSTWRGGGSEGSTYVGTERDIRVSTQIQDTGEGKPHDNMPPYLALTLCRKQ